MVMAAVSGDEARLAQYTQGFPWCLWTPLPGEFLRRIARAAAMVIDIACGPIVENQLLIFAIGTKKSDLDDIDEECSIFNVKTLWIMLFKILSVGEAPRVELDKLLDKTTV